MKKIEKKIRENISAMKKKPENIFKDMEKEKGKKLGKTWKMKKNC